MITKVFGWSVDIRRKYYCYRAQNNTTGGTDRNIRIYELDSDNTRDPLKFQ